MENQEPQPDQGSIETHTGSILQWQRNEAGGRSYYSDECGLATFVWDTCLTDIAVLCEAISMEFALAGAERRAAERERFRSVYSGVQAQLEVPEQPRQECAAPSQPRVRLFGTGELRQIVNLLHRARWQLLQYHQFDPIAHEIALLVGPRCPMCGTECGGPPCG